MSLPGNNRNTAINAAQARFEAQNFATIADRIARRALVDALCQPGVLNEIPDMVEREHYACILTIYAKGLPEMPIQS